MKKSLATLSAFILTSMVLWSANPARAQGLVVKESANLSSYCNIKFPPMEEGTLSWDSPVLEESAGTAIDFYGSCDHSPTGAEEAVIQHRILIDNDGE